MIFNGDGPGGEHPGRPGRGRISAIPPSSPPLVGPPQRPGGRRRPTPRASTADRLRIALDRGHPRGRAPPASTRVRRPAPDGLPSSGAGSGRLRLRAAGSGSADASTAPSHNLAAAARGERRRRRRRRRRERKTVKLRYLYLKTAPSPRKSHSSRPVGSHGSLRLTRSQHPSSVPNIAERLAWPTSGARQRCATPCCFHFLATASLARRMSAHRQRAIFNFDTNAPPWTHRRVYQRLVHPCPR